MLFTLPESYILSGVVLPRDVPHELQNISLIQLKKIIRNIHSDKSSEKFKDHVIYLNDLKTILWEEREKEELLQRNIAAKMRQQKESQLQEVLQANINKLRHGLHNAENNDDTNANDRVDEANRREINNIYETNQVEEATVNETNEDEAEMAKQEKKTQETRENQAKEAKQEKQAKEVKQENLAEEANQENQTEMVVPYALRSLRSNKHTLRYQKSKNGTLQSSSLCEINFCYRSPLLTMQNANLFKNENDLISVTKEMVKNYILQKFKHDKNVKSRISQHWCSIKKAKESLIFRKSLRAN